MSTQDEPGVYYTPSLGFPNHHPNSQDVQQHPQRHPGSHDVLKQCSVKGCTETLTSDDTNKMCNGCRSRHRVYANTKRAKRKLEKAAIATAVAARSEKDTEMSLVDHGLQPITWVNAAGQSRQDLLPSTSGSTLALTSLSTWNHAIDPRLFSGDVSPTSPHHIPSLMPHQTSTSSELANALTPRNPSTPVSVPSSSILPSQAAADHKHYHDLSASQKQSSHLQIPPTPVSNRDDDDDSNDNDEEQRVIESLQVSPVQDQQMEVSSSDRQASSETVELSQGRSSDEVDGSARFCSVKGCKAVIPTSYEYKMCPTCRTRYRTYGNTKRAKWKAERDAFDREMTALRAVEDEKRKAKGLGPLAESPEELRAWELSIIDEQVPVVPADNSSVLPETSPVIELGSATQSLSPSSTLIPGINSPMVVCPPSISSSSTTDPISQYQLNNNPILATAANTSLPARMCTVSHCHKILPGYYRYKRCEQHRLQNRHHSQLKRVREREIKGVGPEKVAASAEIPHEMEADKDKDKLDKETKQATVALTTAGIEGKDADSFSSTTGGGDSESQKRSHDRKRSKFACSVGDCHNLLLPTVRWRLCETCRSRDRQRKNQIKFQEKAPSEKEKMNADSQVGVVSENGHAAVGEAEESQEINHAISAGAIDPDAEGDIDMGENDETEPRAVENQQSFVSPPLSSMPPASTTTGFSRFHVTIDPRNAPSSATLDPKTSTAQLVTLDDPLAFRAYRPKTTPSAIGRILARNPELSVDAFSEVLQAESASTGVMTLSQTNANSTTKSIITPTIPTSAPFVYKAPEKKITPTKGAVAKGKRKASSEKQSISSSTTPAPVPTSASAVTDSTPSAPGSYGSYGYPQYPYPYPYYMPSPYGMPPYPYSHVPPPAPSETKQKSSSKSSTMMAASSSSPAQVPPPTAMPGYSPYPYPYPPPYGYPPPPSGYPYMTTPRYVPGQQSYNGLPPGPSGPNSYPYPYFPLPAPASVPFPKTAAAARERQRAQDTKFNYYHYGAGSSDSPTTPNNKKRKRRKVDSDYLEKFKAQTEAISISLAKNQARRGTSSLPTLPSASIASGSSNVELPVISAQPVALAVDAAADADAPSESITLTRACANKTCNRSLPDDTVNTLCDKCRLRFKKHQAKAKKRFKLEPRKSLFIGNRTISEKKQGSVVEDEK